MEIVTDYLEVVIETSNLIMKKAVFDDWEQLYRNITSRQESAKYMLWKIDDSEEESKDRMLRTLDFQSKEKYALTVYLNGMMKDLSVFQESPFTDQGSAVEIFTDLNVWMGIRKVIESINDNAIAA